MLPCTTCGIVMGETPFPATAGTARCVPSRLSIGRGGWTAWLIGLLLVVLVPAAAAQDGTLQAQRRSTEERLQALKNQIQQDQQRLQEAAEEEEATRDRLEELQREIALREELVSTYRDRLDELEAERAVVRDTLQTLNRRLDALRKEYRRRAEHAYKYGRMHDLALILASASINQMLVRIRYLRRFAEQRRDKRSDVRSAAREVRQRREELEQKRARTEELLAEARSERQRLQTLQEKRREAVESLRAQRSELQQEIEQKRSQAEQLESRIRELAARAEERRSEEEAASPEAAAERREAIARLSASFEDNQGRLPWPADGAVTEGFGDRVDPVHGTTTYHPGILIATNPEANVRAVFRGTVSGIDFVPGYGTYLVIRHGDYLSVYSNFSSLYVSTGDEVEAGQLLGQAGTDNEPRGAGVFFAVFDTSTNESVNPQTWLADR
jgi:septal ring factor EnvC (AmiA/AmiB activator)